MTDFKIVPEFRDKIPPIGDQEFQQLEDNILADKKVFEPLTVWKEKNILLDGHNRWKIIQQHPELPYGIRYLSFSNKWAAFEWMYRNQLGRRNLTDEQRRYSIGKMYEARKNNEGAPANNTNAKKQLDQSGQVVPKTKNTRKAVANELGIGEGTVMRAYEFSRGVDALREQSPEAADKVLAGKAKATKSSLNALSKAKPEALEAAAKAILDDKPIDKPKPAKDKKKCVEPAEEPKTVCEPEKPHVYNIDSLVNEVETDGISTLEGLKRHIFYQYPHVEDTPENRQKILDAFVKIGESFIKAASEVNFGER